MFSFNLYPTDEYDRLIEYFKKDTPNLDESFNEVKDTFIKAYKLTQGDDFIVGATVLGYRNNTYFLDYIKIDKILRKCGLGKILLNKIINFIKKNDGHSMYLITDDSGFFLKQNFNIVSEDEKKVILSNFNIKAYENTINYHIMKIEF